jgi:hypothetical protein
VVQQVSSAFPPTLRYTVLPGTPERGAYRGYLQGSGGPGKFQPVFCIPIEDEIPGSRHKWKRLPQLLDDPTARRRLRDVNVQDVPPIMADDEEAEHSERDVGTVKRSMAAIASRWFRRKASQRLAGSGSLGARFKDQMGLCR